MSYKIGFSVVIFAFFYVGGAGCHFRVSYNDYFCIVFSHSVEITNFVV